MTEARPVTISIAQFNAQDDDKPGNLARACHYLELAGTRGSNIVVLPELFSGTGFSSGEAHQLLAEPIPGPTLTMMAAAARKHAMYVTGSFYERGADGRIYNTAPVLGPGGDLLGCYRKTHLFDVPNRTDLPPGIMESKKVSPGAELQLYDTNLCRFGIGICADIRFPEMFRAYAKAGAELILLPTAFLSPPLRSLGFPVEGAGDRSSDVHRRLRHDRAREGDRHRLHRPLDRGRSLGRHPGRRAR
ncbi:MAG: hypothetical protein IPK59_14320 [Rhodospirillaceae bacterium]|nr:hypothetical protein [Rhodospirillaceae bacterium]